MTPPDIIEGLNLRKIVNSPSSCLTTVAIASALHSFLNITSTPLSVPSWLISPISKNIHKPIEPEIIFESLSVLELTEYYQIVLTDSNGKEVRHVMQIPTQGIPAERDKQICNSILDSKKKLYEYISLILSDDKVQCVLESGDSSYGEGEHGTAVTVIPAIYERMLEASLHHRERFMEIEDMMKMLPDNSSILEEFKKLYDVFCEALKT